MSKRITTSEKIISDLDEIARDYEHYEYGLPTGSDEQMEKMLKVVDKHINSEIKKFKKQVLVAVSAYVRSEGCGCCSNIEQHREHLNTLGKLLNAPKYKDDSGYNFHDIKK